MFKEEVDLQKEIIIQEMKDNVEIQDFEVKECSELKHVDNFEVNRQFKYQMFLQKYAAVIKKSPFTNGILIYHGVGTGKTRTALGMLQEICNISENEKAVVLCPASLIEDPWLKEIAAFPVNKNWKPFQDEVIDILEFHKNKNKRAMIDRLSDDSNFHIISHNSSDKYRVSRLQQITGKNDKILADCTIVVDEIHNVVSSITNAIMEDITAPLPIFYTLLIERGNSTLIGLSATPLVNRPFELAILANIIRGKIPNKDHLKFDLDPIAFDNLFFDGSNTEKLINEKMLARRLVGIVSYYEHSDNNLYAKSTHDVVRVRLSNDQTEGYMIAKGISSKNRAAKQRQMKKESKKYSTEQLLFIKASNAVFPSWLSEEREVLAKRKNGKPIDFQHPLPIDNTNRYIKASSNIDSVHGKFILQALNNDDKPLAFNNDLKNISIKFYHIFARLSVSKGPVIVYSRLNGIYGIALFELTLQQNGYMKYKNSNRDTDALKYILFTGREKLQENINIWNSPENKDGSIIKVILITGAGKEGISLKHVRQVHILEPWWNMIVQKQVSGRGIRMCSHDDLAADEFTDLRLEESLRLDNTKIVNVFHYIAYCNHTRKIGEETLTEFKSRLEKDSLESFIWNKAKEKEVKTNLILDVLKKVSIDCSLPYSKVNMPCFKTDAELDYIFYWNTTDDQDIQKQIVQGKIQDGNLNFYIDNEGGVFENLEGKNNDSMDFTNLNLNQIGRVDVLDPNNIIMEDLSQVDNVMRWLNKTKDIVDDIEDITMSFAINAKTSKAIVIASEWNDVCYTVLSNFSYVYFLIEDEELQQTISEFKQFGTSTDIETIIDPNKFELVNMNLRQLCHTHNIHCMFVTKYAMPAPQLVDHINSVWGKVDGVFIQLDEEHDFDMSGMKPEQFLGSLRDAIGWKFVTKNYRNKLARAVAKVYKKNYDLVLQVYNAFINSGYHERKLLVRAVNKKTKRNNRISLSGNLSLDMMKIELETCLEVLYDDKFWRGASK